LARLSSPAYSGGKEGGREGRKEGRREGGKEGGREGGREGRREGRRCMFVRFHHEHHCYQVFHKRGDEKSRGSRFKYNMSDISSHGGSKGGGGVGGGGGGGGVFGV